MSEPVETSDWVNTIVLPAVSPVVCWEERDPLAKLAETLRPLVPEEPDVPEVPEDPDVPLVPEVPEDPPDLVSVTVR